MNSKIAARVLPAFAIGFTAYYAPAYCFTGANERFTWPLATYFPALNTWRWGFATATETSGPPMYWFGWLFAATLVGLLCAAIALLLPQRTAEKAWPVAIWAIPVIAFIFLANWELVWFVPGWKPILGGGG